MQKSKRPTCLLVTTVQSVGFFNIRSGHVLEKIQGSGSDSGRMGSAIFGYLFYFQVFLGIPWCFWVYRISSLFLGPDIEDFFFHLLRLFFKGDSLRGMSPPMAYKPYLREYM